MVKVGLQISCQFENIEELKTCHPSYAFFVKVKCSNCGEKDGNFHDISEECRVGEDSRNPKGFNFFMKCKLCTRTNSIDIIEGSNGKWVGRGCSIIAKIPISSSNLLPKIHFSAPYTEADAGKFKTIVAFDCRGLELEEFSARTGWIAKGIDGKSYFEDIDLSEDDWADYDEKTSNSVGISEFKSQFVKLKK